MKNQIKKLLNLFLISCFVLGIVGCKQEPEDKLDILDYVYMVNFESNGGTEIKPQTVVYGKKATEPSNPSKEKFVFEGWYTDKDCTKVFNFDTEIKSDITLYAGWKSVHTVSFDANGGILSGPETQSVISGEKVTNPTNPSKENYAFLGWYTDAEFTNKYNFDLAVENSFTLYAKWMYLGDNPWRSYVDGGIQNIGTTSSSNASDYTICEFTSEKQGFYYAIELTEGTYYKIETTDSNRFLSGRSDAKFYLYDKDGNQMRSTDDGTIPFTPSYTGLFYIYMTPYSSGSTGKAGVHVYIPTLISNLSFDTTSVSLKTNEYIDIIATWEPSDADITYINYYSSRSGVASCSLISSGNGYRNFRIYGGIAGEATITLVESASGLYTTCTVNVSWDEDAIINVDSSSIGTTSSVTESDYTICEFTSEKQRFYYAIELTEGTSYTIETTDSTLRSLTGRRDAQFYLYDKDVNQNGYTDDDKIYYTPNYTGLYYIYMTPYSSGSTGKAGFHIYTE